MNNIFSPLRRFSRFFIGGIDDAAHRQSLYDLRAYKSKSLSQLLNLYLVYTYSKSKYLAENSHCIHNCLKSLRLDSFYRSLIYGTSRNLFSVGSDLHSLELAILQNHRPNSHFISSYTYDNSLDQDQSEVTFNSIAQNYIDTIHLAKKSKNPVVTVRYSSFVSKALLERAGQAETWLRHLFLSENGKVEPKLPAKEIYSKLEARNILVPEAEFRQTLSEFLGREIAEDLSTEISRIEWMSNIHFTYTSSPERNENPLIKYNLKMTPDEIHTLSNFIARVQSILQAAKESGVQVIVESEKYEVQNAVDALNLQFALEFNKENATLVSSVQNYFNTSAERVELEIERAKTHNLKIGLNLEIGAFLHPTFAKFDPKSLFYTHNVAYTREKAVSNAFVNASRLLGTLPSNSHVFIEATSLPLIENLVKSSKENLNNKVHFYQSLGVGEHITSYLAREGHHTYKVLPYGEPKQSTHYFKGVLLRLNQDKESLETQRRLVVDEILRRVGF